LVDQFCPEALVMQSTHSLPGTSRNKQEKEKRTRRTRRTTRTRTGQRRAKAHDSQGPTAISAHRAANR